MIREANRDARALIGRDDADGVSQHLIGQRRRLPWLHRRGARCVEALIRGATLDDVGIVRGATTGAAGIAGAAAEPSAATNTSGVADAEALTVRAVQRETVLHAVHDRARVIDNAGAQQRSDYLAAPWLIDAYTIRQPELHGEVGGALDPDEHTAAFDEGLEVGNSLPAQPGPQVFGLRPGADVGRLRRVLPR